MSCTCGPWWQVPRVYFHCDEHAYGEGPVPHHNLDESRKAFPCLDESYRKMIRINANYAQTSDGDD